MSFGKLEAKANEITEQRKKALEQGRRIGTLQSQGICLRPEAPAHLRNMPITLESESEWEIRVERNQRSAAVPKEKIVNPSKSIERT